MLTLKTRKAKSEKSGLLSRSIPSLFPRLDQAQDLQGLKAEQEPSCQRIRQQLLPILYDDFKPADKRPMKLKRQRASRRKFAKKVPHYNIFRHFSPAILFRSSPP
jgi:hypothetical protein